MIAIRKMAQSPADDPKTKLIRKPRRKAALLRMPDDDDDSVVARQKKWRRHAV